MSETTTNIIGALADIRTYIEEKFDFDDPQTENLMIGLADRLDGLSDALAGLAASSPAPAASMPRPIKCPHCGYPPGSHAPDCPIVAAQPRSPEQAVGEDTLRQRVEDAEADALRLHNEKMDFFEKWTAAQGEVERLREALRPFAEYARALDDGSATRGIPNAAPVTYNPDRAYGSAINVGDLRKARAALAASPEPKLVECDQCGGTGFDTPGTGYGNVCSKCGGQRELPAEPGAGAGAQDKDAT